MKRMSLIEKFKTLVVHTCDYIHQESVSLTITDLRHAALISTVWSMVIKVAIPELAHGLLVIFWACASTVAVFFLQRFLKSWAKEKDSKNEDND